MFDEALHFQGLHQLSIWTVGEVVHDGQDQELCQYHQPHKQVLLVLHVLHAVIGLGISEIGFGSSLAQDRQQTILRGELLLTGDTGYSCQMTLPCFNGVVIRWGCVSQERERRERRG